VTVVFALLVGVALGFYTDRQTQRRIRAERNLARLERDRNAQDRDQALNNNVRVLDPHRLALAVQKHPAGSRLPRQDRR
jgi:uncharacterized membrane-anchored protein YhcB (DUF1043 family)